MTYVPPPPIAPTVRAEPPPMEGTVKTHPAYGLLGISRVQGNPGTLFGSEIKQPMSFIRITLTRAEDHWSLSRSWHHSRQQLVELDMTHSQFAEMITTLNVGSGVPCTIRYLPGEELPRIADDSTIHDQIKADVKDTAHEAVDRIKALHAAIAEAKLPKGVQNKLLELARSAAASLDNSLPFVLDQYQEALDSMKAKAAAEVDAMLTGAIQRAGLNALKLDSGVSAPTLHS